MITAMNVYDFDHTIYPGDSTVDFWRYCLKRYPRVLLALPGACLFGATFYLRLCSRERFKETFYRFLLYVPDAQAAAEAFWETRLEKIEPWYLAQRRDDDLVISASPEFLIRAACDRLNIPCLASKVDSDTGKLEGPNCRGEEKLRRFREAYPNEEIERFYSDSPSDAPLAREAAEAYLIKKGNVKRWET